MTITRALGGVVVAAAAASLALAGCAPAYSSNDVERAVGEAEGWGGEWYTTTAGDEVEAFADWGEPLAFLPDACRQLYLVSTLVVLDDEGSDDPLFGVITQAEWPSTDAQFGAVRVTGSAEAAAEFVDAAEAAAQPCAGGYIEGDDRSWVVESVDISRVQLGELGEALVIDERNIESTDGNLDPVVGDYTTVIVTRENLVLLVQYFDASDPIESGAAEADLGAIISEL